MPMDKMAATVWFRELAERTQGLWGEAGSRTLTVDVDFEEEQGTEGSRRQIGGAGEWGADR